MTRRPARGFDVFCRSAVDLLDTASVPYLLIGGLAVAVVGEPRMTADIDVIAYVDLDRAAALIEVARAAGFDADPDERANLLATGTLRFTRGGLQLDIIVASLPFEETARQRARPRTLFGRRVPVPSAEDLLLFKVLAGRPKDLVDAAGIARRHGGRLDLRYLTATLDQICDLAEDLEPRRRLDEVLGAVR